MSDRAERSYNIKVDGVSPSEAPENLPGALIYSKEYQISIPGLVAEGGEKSQGYSEKTVTVETPYWIDSVPVEIIAQQIANLLYFYDISSISISLKPRKNPPTIGESSE